MPRQVRLNTNQAYVSLSFRERAGVRERASAATTDASTYPAGNPGTQAVGQHPLTPTQREKDQHLALSATRNLRLAPPSP